MVGKMTLGPQSLKYLALCRSLPSPGLGEDTECSVRINLGDNLRDPKDSNT